MPGPSIRCGNVAVTVLRRRGDDAEVLLLKRSKGLFAGLWSQITGRIEGDEKAWQTALRELREEAGLDPDRLYTADFCDQFYNAADDCIEIVPIFVALVDDDADARINHEHTEHRWVGILEASEIVPFVGHRLSLREIHRDFIVQTPKDWMLLQVTGPID